MLNKKACKRQLGDHHAQGQKKRDRLIRSTQTGRSHTLALVSFTVVPLHNLNLPAGSRVAFGNDFVLQEVPEWVKKGSQLEHLSRNDRQRTLDASHALVAEYEASSIGEPEPAWMGENPKAIQEMKLEAAMLANMARWLIQPSTTCFTLGFHAI